MIAIYSNSNPIVYGGVEVLVARFAEYLRDSDVPFILIEPAGTRLYEELRWADPLDPHKFNVMKNHVTQLFLPNVSKLRHGQIPWSVCGDAKVFGWIVHPNEPFRSFFPFSGKLCDVIGYRAVGLLRAAMPRHREIVESVFRELTVKKALAVMDGATTRALNYFYPSIPFAPAVIPIPSEPHPQGSQPKRTAGLSVGYLGRLDDFKYSALAPFVANNLAARARREHVELHMVSEGPRMANLRKLCRKSSVSLYEYGFKPNIVARDIISSRTKFAVAMGTAALDIAGAGHPCIILDPALRNATRPQVAFNFVSGIKQHTLGEYRDFSGYVRGEHEFAQIVDLAVPEMGIAGREYVLREHHPRKVFESLTKAIAESQMTVNELAQHCLNLESSFHSIRKWF